MPREVVPTQNTSERLPIQRRQKEDDGCITADDAAGGISLRSTEYFGVRMCYWD